MRTGQTDEACRQDLIAEHRDLLDKSKELAAEIKRYEKCDPERLQLVKKQTKLCHDAAIRWTDNLF